MRTMTLPKIANKIAKFLLDTGTGRMGSTTATATARHADADGAVNGQVSEFTSLMHGYATENKTYMVGARNTAQQVPMPWANHWSFGDVRKRKPTRKSPVRSS